MELSRAKVAVWSVVAAVLTLPLALKPPPDPSSALAPSFRPLVGEWGFLDNTDSRQFWLLAEDPGRLLVEGEIRQSRPVFVVLGVTARWIVSPFVDDSESDPHATSRVGYTLLNVLTLATSIGLTIALLRRVGIPASLIACAVSVLMVNVLTRTFYWTAHTQILTLFASVLLVFVGYHSLIIERTWRWRFAMALGFGTLSLTSGFFIVGLPVLWVTGETDRRRANRPFTWSRLWREIVLGLAFLAPTLIWVSTTALISGSFYSHETSGYRQFVWILDALGQSAGVLWSTSMSFLGAFLQTLSAATVIPYLVVAVAVTISYVARERWSISHHATHDLQLVSLLVMWLLLAFLALLGYYRMRLTAAIIPPAVILLLTELKAREWAESTVIRLTVAAATVLWAWIHLINPNPYS